MCDCPEERVENVIEETERINDVGIMSLFERCPKSVFDPEENIKGTARRSRLRSEIMHRENWRSTMIPQSVPCSTPVYEELKKPASSEYSSCSTRYYKFVEPWELEYLECGEEVPEHFPMSYQPYGAKENKEDEKSVIECTLAIIKPEAIVYRKEIETRIFEENFEVYQTRWLQMTPEQVSEFYSDNYGQTYFAHLVAYMASAPVFVLVLAKRQAVRDWRSLMGPTKVAEARLYFPDSIRARFGRKGEDFKNAVHGSVNRERAEKEIHFFFPEFVVEPLLKDEMAVDYLWKVINSVLLEGLTLCCRLKPADPVLWLANWLIMNNPNKPKLSEDLAIIPT